jgi:hypothetical protein
MTLYRSKDRKVTNSVTPSGKSPRIANTFGLPSGTPFSCPGATSFCERICYAGNIERQYSAVMSRMISNFEQLLYADYLSGIQGMVDLLHEMVFVFEQECEKKDAPKLFRIHWDGDFFSAEYAEAWSAVIRYFPDITFWVYTRSFTDKLNVVPILAGIPNLTLYLSADPVNQDIAKVVSEKYNVPIALVADTFAEAREALDAEAYNCPENGKRIPLISEKGSACVRCGICVVGRGNVLFSVKKR